MAAQLMTMAHTSSNNDNNTKSSDLSSATFHDFLGISCGEGTSDSPVVMSSKGAGDVVRLSEASLTGSASVGGSSGGGRVPVSTTSDLGSERQVGNHIEGVPFYGPRSDISRAEIRYRLAGSKRSNSDSAFIESTSRDGIPQIRTDSFENSHLMKMLHSRALGERSRRPDDDESLFNVQIPRPNSASLIQSQIGSKNNANITKWERPKPMNMSPVMQHISPRGVQFSPSMHQVGPHRFKDPNAGPPFISQLAADEGSRTGIKGSILSSINDGTGVPERKPSGATMQKSVTHALEPESTMAPSRHGLTSSSKQMTIFYGGQAHVFDEVHPNKADVIMSLAGSNGGSWSTTYSPKSNARPVSESHIPQGDNEIGTSNNNIAFLQELRGKSSVVRHSSHGFTSNDRFQAPTWGNQGSSVAKDTRNAAQATELSTDEKTEV